MKINTTKQKGHTTWFPSCHPAVFETETFSCFIEKVAEAALARHQRVRDTSVPGRDPRLDVGRRMERKKGVTFLL